MTLYDELYFEITFIGEFSEIKKIASFIKSGELDDFFPDANEYIIQNDTEGVSEGAEKATLVFSTDDYGIEIDEFDVQEFLDVICRVGKNVYVSGAVYDVDEDEYEFVSDEGVSYYVNARSSVSFNDELDTVRREEEDEDEDEEEF